MDKVRQWTVNALPVKCKGRDRVMTCIIYRVMDKVRQWTGNALPVKYKGRDIPVGQWTGNTRSVK